MAAPVPPSAAAAAMPAQQAPLICPGHSRPVAGIEFSDVTEDGVFLISACHDKTAMIRSGTTGDWIGTFQGHKGAVWWAALDRTATRAVTCSADYTAKVWDALTGDELFEWTHRKIVRAADWAPDSTHLVTGGKEGLLRLFDASRPDAEPTLLEGHTQTIKVVKFVDSQSPTLFLSGGEDSTLRLWDTRTASEVRQLSFDGSVNSVELSRDKRTVTVAAGAAVSFWETASYECEKRYTLPVIEANGYGVNSATLHPDRKAFVAAGGNFYVYVHDYETGEELQCNKGHHGPVYGVRFTPSGNTYASGGDDGTIRIWNYATNGEAEAAVAAPEAETE